MAEFQYSDSFKKAQIYEIQSNNRWQENNSKVLLEELNKYKKGKEISWTSENGWLDEFFDSSKNEFLKFNDEIKSKNNLEIGPGPFGFLQCLYWLKNRITIDPLLNEYRDKQIEILGESWYSDKNQKFYSQPAEIYISELENSIDGFIVCRNCLDHCQDWKKVLENISKYSKIGSYFLLWTDLTHGSPDDGHFHITDNMDYFKNIIEDLGYEIIREKSLQSGELNFGCFAKKII